MIRIHCAGLCAPPGFGTWAFVASENGAGVHARHGAARPAPAMSAEVAAYTAIIEALGWANGAGARDVEILSNERAVILQIKGLYRCPKPVAVLVHDARVIANTIAIVKFTAITRRQNALAVELAKVAQGRRAVFVEDIEPAQVQFEQ